MIEIYQNISLNDLMTILKQEVKEITLQDLYELSFHFKEETKYLPREYKKKYIESILNVIVDRFTSLKNDNNNYPGNLSDSDTDNVKELIQPKENVINHILNITAIYATYILKQPIHLPGTVFPGNVSIFCDGRNYYCPVKKFHVNSDYALCKYCIAITQE